MLLQLLFLQLIHLRWLLLRNFKNLQHQTPQIILNALNTHSLKLKHHNCKGSSNCFYALVTTFSSSRRSQNTFQHTLSPQTYVLTPSSKWVSLAVWRVCPRRVINIQLIISTNRSNWIVNGPTCLTPCAVQFGSNRACNSVELRVHCLNQLKVVLVMHKCHNHILTLKHHHSKVSYMLWWINVTLVWIKSGIAHATIPSCLVFSDFNFAKFFSWWYLIHFIQY